VRNGLTEVVIELLKVDGLDVNIRNSYRYTALMCACGNNGHTERMEEVIKLMYPRGLDFKVLNSDGYTALIWACTNGHADTALALLRDPRVDRHHKNTNGSNALALARQNGLTAVVTRFKALAHTVGEGASSPSHCYLYFSFTSLHFTLLHFTLLHFHFTSFTSFTKFT
jgi:pentatricopeptide repeat protein